MNKITYKGKVKIIDNYEAIKPKNKELETLFNYLEERNFKNYPKIIKEEDNYIRYSYYEEIKSFRDNKIQELPKIIATLHYQTAYYKDVSNNKYKEIYDKLIDNIDFIKEYYNKLIKQIDTSIYMSPSNYLLARNFSIINSNLIYVEKELNSWFKLVKDKTKERVCVVHNNLKINNVLKSKELILTGWDNYLVDTPILDIYKLYKYEYLNIDFKSFLNTYNEIFELSKEEIKLFNILISLINKIELNSSEYNNTLEVKKLLEYIYKTNEIIKVNVNA